MYMPHMPAELAAAAGMATRAYPLSPQSVFPAGGCQEQAMVRQAPGAGNGQAGRDTMRELLWVYVRVL